MNSIAKEFEIPEATLRWRLKHSAPDDGPCWRCTYFSLFAFQHVLIIFDLCSSGSYDRRRPYQLDAEEEQQLGLSSFISSVLFRLRSAVLHFSLSLSLLFPNF